MSTDLVGSRETNLQKYILDPLNQRKFFIGNWCENFKYSNRSSIKHLHKFSFILTYCRKSFLVLSIKKPVDTILEASQTYF